MLIVHFNCFRAQHTLHYIRPRNEYLMKLFFSPCCTEYQFKSSASVVFGIRVRGQSYPQAIHRHLIGGLFLSCISKMDTETYPPWLGPAPALCVGQGLGEWHQLGPSATCNTYSASILHLKTACEEGVRHFQTMVVSRQRPPLSVGDLGHNYKSGFSLEA